MDTDWDDLKESNEFLKLLLENINSAVLIADEHLQIHQFNRVFLQLFDQAGNRTAEKSFGRISGCVHAVQENKACGETSQCRFCLLRRSLVKTFLEKTPCDKLWLERVFYINGRPVEKYLEFSTRHITFRGRKMILVIIYDVTDLEKQKIELEKKQHQLDLDLQAAAGIQQSLLPKCCLTRANVRLAWKFEPSGQVGGDIFNLCEPSPGRLAVYMLDVCGHGVSAAMISVTVSQFLQSLGAPEGGAGAFPEPAAVLNRLNREFPFERFDSYFTIIFVDIDLYGGEMRYSCAGHPPPILLPRAGDPEVLKQHGPVIGLDEDAAFDQHRRRLRPGDRLVLYTDGLVDVANGAGELFGRQRLHAALQAARREPIARLADRVYDTVKGFGGGRRPEDDLSLMVVEYTGPRA